jgi:hypothetical protein
LILASSSSSPAGRTAVIVNPIGLGIGWQDRGCAGHKEVFLVLCHYGLERLRAFSVGKVSLKEGETVPGCAQVPEIVPIPE